MHATTTEFGRMCKEKTEYPNYKHHCHRPDQSSVFPASPSGPLAPIVACLNPQAQTANMKLTIFPPSSRTHRPKVSWLEGVEYCLGCAGHVDPLLEHPEFRVARQ